jgi:quercetin dioxygenase-like cupin family protein
MTRLDAGAAERIVDDPVLRQRYSFSVTRDEDGGEVLHVDTWVDPGGGVTAHVHGAMEERFHVLAGTPSFLAGRKWSTAAPGDVVVVPAGLRHSYRNDRDEPAHIRCDVRPPSSLQAFLEEVAELSRAGRITRRGLPTSFGAALQLAALVQRHREMVTLGPPAPPPFLQRLIIPPLARLAERRGL